MKIKDAIKAIEESILRYNTMKQKGEGKNVDQKIQIAKSQLTKLNEMKEGGTSPWRDYSNIIIMWEIEDFYPKIIRKGE